VTTATLPSDIPGLVRACDDPRIFGVELTPVQRGLLEAVEAGSLLHVWALGRRAGKTLMAVLVALWMCTLRPDLAAYARRRERRFAVAVATNLRQARIFVRQAREIADGSPFLAGLVERVTDDQIEFKLGTTLAAFPCTSRGGRGWPVMCLLMDEAAHFVDGDGNQAAEPVWRALAPSVAQFGDVARIVVASTPFGVDGWFAGMFEKAAAGGLEGAVAQHASTAEANPRVPRSFLAAERARDPEGYRSEYDAEFVPAGGAFLGDWARVEEAARRGGELDPGEALAPTAALDVAFTQDSTGLAVVGRDREDARRLRLVLARRWEPGSHGFADLLDEVAAACRDHGVRHVYLDQFAAVPVAEGLRRAGLQPSVIPTTAASKTLMFQALKARIYAGELDLYRHPGLLDELARIETVTTPGAASVRIRRVGSSHGDLATALALAAWKAPPPARRSRTINPNDLGVDILDLVAASRGGYG
jgi:hypothetical protein